MSIPFISVREYIPSVLRFPSYDSLANVFPDWCVSSFSVSVLKCLRLSSDPVTLKLRRGKSSASTNSFIRANSDVELAASSVIELRRGNAIEFQLGWFSKFWSANIETFVGHDYWLKWLLVREDHRWFRRLIERLDQRINRIFPIISRVRDYIAIDSCYFLRTVTDIIYTDLLIGLIDLDCNVKLIPN